MSEFLGLHPVVQCFLIVGVTAIIRAIVRRF